MISLLSDVNPEWGLCLAVAVVGFTIIANAYRVWKRTHAPCPPPSPSDSPSKLTSPLLPVSSHTTEIEESQSSIQGQQNSEKQNKYEKIRERAKAALDSIPAWAQEDSIKYLNGQSKPQLKPRCQHTDEGHQVINMGVETMLEDVLKELLSRLQVKYKAEDMKKLKENLQTFFTKHEEKILRDLMVVDLGHKVPDFSRQVFGIFSNVLIQSIADYMEDSIKNIHNSSCKRLSKRVNEITSLMNQYEVYVDAVARDEWVQIGNKNRQVYGTPEDREKVYEVMRDVVKGNLNNILRCFTKILEKSKIAYKNDLDIYYYWS
ncbi:uncharacterized protein LOC121712025 [Alosa sapidissima]|uniref:uncharacterized protein LOC121712025 n=1 Tax=Alosa sapidissima TaxID=34773 RepID=UPI001C0804AC|nr:uncharacterized protein LOC121712025 [Alosa sapidissima]